MMTPQAAVQQPSSSSSLLLVSDVSSKGWSVSKLQWALRTILLCQQQQHHTVPAELFLVDHILEYVIIEPVRHVRAICCSSQLEDDETKMPLSECLQDSESTWWISKPQSQIPTNDSTTDSSSPSYEYVDFDLTRGFTTEEHDNRRPPSMVRLSAIEIKIPPLPQGPCSLYEFRLESLPSSGNSTDGNTKQPVVLVHGFLENRTGYQRFPIDHPTFADVSTVRLVCISNQISRFQHPNSRLPANLSNVGFYAIRFS
jgi:hypothetical protein